ncbi:MAG TPA: hypothetical protein VKB93_14660 [Thermoanaerobaculia bacterium]|nr:hypothetical protein [Thermoanaerobaculia bacterium]
MMIFLFLLLLLGDDQTPRPPAKNKSGLLQIDRDLYGIAAATGGDFYFWAAGEFATSNLQIPIEYDEVLLSYGTVDTKRVFEIPVETGVPSLQVFAGVQRKDLAVLLRPDGTIVREHDQGTAVQSFQHMLIAVIEKPPPGVWRLELHGAGTFCVTAHVQPGEQSVGFDKAIVKKDGTCSVEISGNADRLQLEFVAKDGTVISRQRPGPCTVPTVPFRIAITGVDAKGKEFRRIERALRQ